MVLQVTNTVSDEGKEPWVERLHQSKGEGKGERPPLAILSWARLRKFDCNLTTFEHGPIDPKRRGLRTHIA